MLDLAGLLAYSLFAAFPLLLNSGLKYKQFTEFTATGIAPDLNGIPFSSANRRNQIRYKANR